MSEREIDEVGPIQYGPSTPHFESRHFIDEGHVRVFRRPGDKPSYAVMVLRDEEQPGLNVFATFEGPYRFSDKLPDGSDQRRATGLSAAKANSLATEWESWLGEAVAAEWVSFPDEGMA